MSELAWHDRFTGTKYRLSSAWRERVQEHISYNLKDAVGQCTSVREAADQAAWYWRSSYYEQLFPLRFGLTWQDQLVTQAGGWEDAQAIDLHLSGGGRLRAQFLAGDGLPPILPDLRGNKPGWLISDRLLVEAALLNTLLAGQEQWRHAARLAALTYPFRNDLQPSLRGLAGDSDLVDAISAVLAGEQSRELPDTLLKTVCAVRDAALGDYRVDIVLVAVQRIKQYVFETAGLNEIRGASTLLDEITDAMADQIGQQIGPEVVLRAAGSTLLFLAPASNDQSPWPEHLRRSYLACTGTAFPAAGALTVPAADLLHNFGPTVSQVYGQIEQDRARGALPVHMTLPFEARCALCQTRAADGWEKAPEEDRPICRVCKTKRDTGRSSRRGKSEQVLRDLGVHDSPGAIGVKKDWAADDLQSLIAGGVRRDLLGVVYGDGNNFGAVSMNLPDIALSVQWAARVELTTRAAAAIALGKATQQGALLRGWRPGAAARLDHLPFQVLALGGDDISLLAWGPVALHFAAEFARLNDLELHGTGPDWLLHRQPLTYSLGVLVTDAKTPVRKSVDFTEEELLKWAKRGAHESGLHASNIAMLYAQSAEGIPDDLERYRDHLYMLGQGTEFGLCMTLRPYSAGELQHLLAVTAELVRRGNLSRLQRMAGAFYGARQSALTGLLHYAYLKARRGDWVHETERALLPTANGGGKDRSLLVKYPVSQGRLPFGIKPQHAARDLWFSPLWDLIELAKVLS